MTDPQRRVPYRIVRERTSDILKQILLLASLLGLGLVFVWSLWYYADQIHLDFLSRETTKEKEKTVIELPDPIPFAGDVEEATGEDLIAQNEEIKTQLAQLFHEKNTSAKALT